MRSTTQFITTIDFFINFLMSWSRNWFLISDQLSRFSISSITPQSVLTAHNNPSAMSFKLSIHLVHSCSTIAWFPVSNTIRILSPDWCFSRSVLNCLISYLSVALPTSADNFLMLILTRSLVYAYLYALLPYLVGLNWRCFQELYLSWLSIERFHTLLLAGEERFERSLFSLQSLVALVCRLCFPGSVSLLTGVM